jgi:hypothetical protein
MRWAGEVAHIRDTYSNSDGQSEGKDNLGYLSLGRRIILKLTLKNLVHKSMDSLSYVVIPSLTYVHTAMSLPSASKTVNFLTI